MLAGVDTGFFFRLQEKHPVALEIWNTREIVTSSIVIYELQKKLLQGQFCDRTTLIEDIKRSVVTIPVTTDIALKAAHLAHGTGMPGLDALILACLLDAACNQIYTVDPHFQLYKNKEIEIIML